ncbi:uncharacterized protein LOC133195005 [Saccostrea echinata]|uniref:uncharacterized protein LOC133195005 n=1 Tax=Saccostrea echinata TaxID=191078 RepID=UPI002A802561|nr:uncharacterized protein LOC133195005 [Saccostrea echinata]
MPTFSPTNINREQTYKLFGSLTSIFGTIQKEGYRRKKSKSAAKELLEEPRVLATINTGYRLLCNVTFLSKGDFWTSAACSDLIKCFNIEGSLKKTFRTKSRECPGDISVANGLDLMYCDLITKTVNKVKDEEIEEVIRLQGWIPLNLCATTSGDLLVTMYSDDKTQSKVVRYSGSTEKQTIQFDDEGKPLYSGNGRCKYICVNRKLDICMADLGAGAVVVISQAGKLKFRYTGHHSTTKKLPFEPWGITTDSQCQILISDKENHCIHILDQDGQFLRFIDNCDLKDPHGLCIDKKDNLFVAEYFSGNVKKIKYAK